MTTRGLLSSGQASKAAHSHASLSTSVFEVQLTPGSGINMVTFDSKTSAVSCTCSFHIQRLKPCPHIVTAWFESQNVYLHKFHWNQRWYKHTAMQPELDQNMDTVKVFYSAGSLRSPRESIPRSDMKLTFTSTLAKQAVCRSEPVVERLDQGSSTANTIRKEAAKLWSLLARQKAGQDLRISEMSQKSQAMSLAMLRRCAELSTTFTKALDEVLASGKKGNYSDPRWAVEVELLDTYDKPSTTTSARRDRQLDRKYGSTKPAGRSRADADGARGRQRSDSSSRSVSPQPVKLSRALDTPMLVRTFACSLRLFTY